MAGLRLGRVAAPIMASLLALLALPGISGAAGVSGPAFYVDGRLYRTVGTPTDFSRTGAPLHSFDTIYEFGGIQRNVATAAPGDRGFNGGRWMVHRLVFTTGGYAAALADDLVDSNRNDVIDSDEEVLAAITRGYAADAGVIRMFECPVIRVPANG
jgi:hypothetical protein